MSRRAGIDRVLKARCVRGAFGGVRESTAGRGQAGGEHFAGRREFRFDHLAGILGVKGREEAEKEPEKTDHVCMVTPYSSVGINCSSGTAARRGNFATAKIASATSE